MLTHIPDYENYDYSREWQGKTLNDLAEKAILRKWVRSGDKCLELGGGFGRMTSILQPLFQTVVMVDFSRRNLTIAKKRLSKGTTSIIRSDVHKIPFGDSFFDTIIMVRLVHHFPNPRVVLDEIARVGKNGSTVVISIPNAEFGRIHHLSTNTLLTVGEQGHRIYAAPLRTYTNSSMQIEKRRGTGIFENFIGSKLKRFEFLYLVDALTSPAWFLKKNIFLKYTVRK